MKSGSLVRGHGANTAERGIRTGRARRLVGRSRHRAPRRQPEPGYEQNSWRPPTSCLSSEGRLRIVLALSEPSEFARATAEATRCEL